jgi:hypothetical protein
MDHGFDPRPRRVCMCVCVCVCVCVCMCVRVCCRLRQLRVPPLLPLRLPARAVLFLLASGAYIAVARWASSSMASAGTRPEPGRPTSALVGMGPYAHCRHPMFVAATLQLLGFALLFNSRCKILIGYGRPLPITVCDLCFLVGRGDTLHIIWRNSWQGCWCWCCRGCCGLSWLSSRRRRRRCSSSLGHLLRHGLLQRATHDTHTRTRARARTIARTHNCSHSYAQANLVFVFRAESS